MTAKPKTIPAVPKTPKAAVVKTQGIANANITYNTGDKGAKDVTFVKGTEVKGIKDEHLKDMKKDGIVI